MPHTHSNEITHEMVYEQNINKWLELLHASVPNLFQRFSDAYREKERLNLIVVYSQTKHFGPIIRYVTLRYDDPVIAYTHVKSPEYSEVSAYAIDCSIYYYGNERYDCSLPLNVLKAHGIDFGKEQIEMFNSETPDEMADILYNWVQDTLRREFCRLRSERIKEELVAAVWRPDRVARRLEKGGWGAVEALG